MMNLKIRVFAVGFAGALALSMFAGTAFAGKPADPGCFGQDRAEYIHTVFQTDDTAPGASEWGHTAADRAGSNGDQNRAYKTLCGGDPTP